MSRQTTHSYSHLPPPPAPFHSVDVGHFNGWPDTPDSSPDQKKVITTHPVYSLRSRIGDSENIRIVSLTEYLWQALLLHCDHCCHHILFDLRGSYRIRISSGFHDGKNWTFQSDFWDDVVEKAVLTMMPGYWTPSWKPLQCGILEARLQPIAERICQLRPGEAILVDPLALEENPQTRAIRQLTNRGTPLDDILESILGAAFELCILPRKENSRNYTVKRLQTALDSSSDLRTYVCPDRLDYYYPQDPATGLYRPRATRSPQV